MSRMGDFIAFQAAVGLLADRGMEHKLQEIYKQCKDAEAQNQLHERNFVKEVYAPFTPDEISEKIARMLRHEDVTAEVDVIYQSIEGLHEACPHNQGDWYFTGNYPTSGGNRVANRAFMKYMEKQEGRGY
jgi:amidophosphoribosyltransferase